MDLKKFRKIAAGDRLRGQYQGLSQDPNSLSNLDQVCFYWVCVALWAIMADWDLSFPGQTSVTARCQWQVLIASTINAGWKQHLTLKCLKTTKFSSILLNKYRTQLGICFLGCPAPSTSLCTDLTLK